MNLTSFDEHLGPWLDALAAEATSKHGNGEPYTRDDVARITADPNGVLVTYYVRDDQGLFALVNDREVDVDVVFYAYGSK